MSVLFQFHFNRAAIICAEIVGSGSDFRRIECEHVPNSGRHSRLARRQQVPTTMSWVGVPETRNNWRMRSGDERRGARSFPVGAVEPTSDASGVLLLSMQSVMMTSARRARTVHDNTV